MACCLALKESSKTELRCIKDSKSCLEMKPKDGSFETVYGCFSYMEDATKPTLQLLPCTKTDDQVVEWDKTDIVFPRAISEKHKRFLGVSNDMNSLVFSSAKRQTRFRLLTIVTPSQRAGCFKKVGLSK